MELAYPVSEVGPLAICTPSELYERGEGGVPSGIDTPPCQIGSAHMWRISHAGGARVCVCAIGTGIGSPPPVLREPLVHRARQHYRRCFPVRIAIVPLDCHSHSGVKQAVLKGNGRLPPRPLLVALTGSAWGLNHGATNTAEGMALAQAFVRCSRPCEMRRLPLDCRCN